MGKRSKERQLVQQAGRRKAVLQIGSVSRREVSQASAEQSSQVDINPTNITGIGLLGAYADHSDEEQDMEEKSQPPAKEIDAQLEDFFKEIRSMESEDPVTSKPGNGGNFQQEQDNDKEHDEEPMEEDPNYPWQACRDEASNCYYYWNQETNEVQWEMPPGFEFLDTNGTEVEAPRVDNESEDVIAPEESNAVETDHSAGIPEVTGIPGDGDNDYDDKKSEDSVDGYQVLDDINTELDDEQSSIKAADDNVDDEKDDDGEAGDDPPQKKPRLGDTDDDDFAAQLLEDTYEKGTKDMEMSDTEEDRGESTAPLLPPEAFERAATPPDVKTADITPLVARQVHQYSEAEEEAFMDKVIAISSLIQNKLHFLHIAASGISNLHVLLVEMECRIRDWREGALDSGYLVKKLQEAEEHIKEYEESASPPGWSCHWDRKYKQYFYTNLETKKSQWEFPTDDAEPETSTDGAPSFSTAVETIAAVTMGMPTQATMTAITPAAAPVAQPWPNASAVMPSSMYAPVPMQLPMVTVAMSSLPLGHTTAHYQVPIPAVAPAVTPSEEPPPPEPPEECPPPPPGDEMALRIARTPSVTSGRSLIDYSDLDSCSASPPPLPPSEPPGVVSGTSSPLPATTMISKPKKKKKAKAPKVGTSMKSSKLKKVSSLVQKWQTIKQQVAQEEEPELTSSEEEEDMSDMNERMIEEWKRNQLVSGQAAFNPNFAEVKGDWRERLKKKDPT
ncbi:formin-binding protein 4 isoform X2 [Nematostella vectensis]|uniref:formin-binding protein 4 isoform X2 n=1 Tax=Nematostella vectensis TaxID=45351 RepID=UPI0020773313|nr:formin-binding protein 4 isoform X2 [Nematostella vectensis]